MKYLLLLIASCVINLSIAQHHHQIDEIENRQSRDVYFDAYEYLNKMLLGDTVLSFKYAVYAVENAYLNNGLDYDTFNLAIEYYANLASLFAEKAKLEYQGKDKNAIAQHGAIFTVMTAKEPIFLDSSYYLKPDPFRYDFEDFWGEQDWTKMFVSKLLSTHQGNCHSLPYLYKILADELGVKAYLSFAPNHTYIKIRAQNPKIGWYNTELTNATFPIDAWIKSSGYVHLDAIRNGLYMDTLSAKQEIAINMIDLAKGYERIFRSKDDLDFLLICANRALEYYPNYANALLLKAETMKKQFENVMTKSGAKYAKQIFGNPEAKQLFDEMEQLYFKIFQMGYRNMPKEMYINWLTDLKEHKEKYVNKQLIQNLGNSDND